jgi:hypothetical protein
VTVLVGASEHPGPVFVGTVETGWENDDGHQDRRPLSNRDRAVLRAVAAGRCQISYTDGDGLIVDGLCFHRPVVDPASPRLV